jgi:ATP-dependent Lhr-like helicase
MRRMVTQKATKDAATPLQSSFAQALAERRSELGMDRQPVTIRRPGRAQYRSAKRRVRQRISHEVKPAKPWVGRWTPVHRFGVLGKKLPLSEYTERQTRQLLTRYGVVTYTSLSEEQGAWDWQLISRNLQRMEMRGEVRRGYFIKGMPGVQYALPDIVDQLRAFRDHVDSEQLVVMNAADPANLYGPQRDDLPLMADGAPAVFSRIASNYIVQHKGLPLIIATNQGGSLRTLDGADNVLLQQGLLALFKHLSTFMPRLTIEKWNGQPILESNGQVLLESVGCYRAYPGMEWARPR